MTPTRLHQVMDLLAGIEAEISNARDELRRLESERRRIGTTLVVSLGPNGGLTLDLGGESKTQFIRIPASDKGAQVMVRILQDRERTWDRSLGSEARPVQAQVNKWLAEAAAATRGQPTKPSVLPDLSLDDLGI